MTFFRIARSIRNGTVASDGRTDREGHVPSSLRDPLAAGVGSVDRMTFRGKNSREEPSVEERGSETMAGPLEGFRIVDLTVGYSGPYACMILGDQAAEVIKVEPVGYGELTRLDPGQRGTLNPSFISVNRSKRAIQLDLKSPRGIELLLEVVKTCLLYTSPSPRDRG